MPGAGEAYLKVSGYAPHGGVLEQVYGNGLVERTAYNGRLQVTRLRAGVSAGDIACGVDGRDELCLEWGFRLFQPLLHQGVITQKSQA